MYTQEERKKSGLDEKPNKITPKMFSHNIENCLNHNQNSIAGNSKLNISSLIKSKIATQQSIAPMSSVPLTKLHSKNNSKSSSRIEEKPNAIKKVESEVKKIDINILIKPAQTKIPSLQATINNNCKNNSNNILKKHSTTTNSPKNTMSMNFNKDTAKKNINSPIDKCGKQVLSLKLNLNNLNHKEVMINDKNLIKDMKNNNIINTQKKNLSIDNILETSNCSVMSSMRESNYYKKESEKLSNYIKMYFIKYNEYPATNVKNYKYGRLIGKGAFGKVNLGLHTLTGRIVAIKSFNIKLIPNDSAKKKIYYETNLMNNLKHNAIVK